MLDNVYWIGGGSCSGKSDVADVLGARHGLPVYHAGDHREEHILRQSASSNPSGLNLSTLEGSLSKEKEPMGDKGGKRDKGKKEQQKLAGKTLKEKRKLKKEKMM